MKTGPENTKKENDSLFSSGFNIISMRNGISRSQAVPLVDYEVIKGSNVITDVRTMSLSGSQGTHFKIVVESPKIRQFVEDALKEYLCRGDEVSKYATDDRSIYLDNIKACGNEDLIFEDIDNAIVDNRNKLLDSLMSSLIDFHNECIKTDFRKEHPTFKSLATRSTILISGFSDKDNLYVTSTDLIILCDQIREVETALENTIRSE